MKKLLAMLLAAVMVLSLAACGGAGGSGGSGGGDAAKVDTTAEGFKIADYTWETQPGSNKYEAESSVSCRRSAAAVTITDRRSKG